MRDGQQMQRLAAGPAFFCSARVRECGVKLGCDRRALVAANALRTRREARPSQRPCSLPLSARLPASAPRLTHRATTLLFNPASAQTMHICTSASSTERGALRCSEIAEEGERRNGSQPDPFLHFFSPLALAGRERQACLLLLIYESPQATRVRLRSSIEQCVRPVALVDHCLSL